jgi:hypothetical protein
MTTLKEWEQLRDIVVSVRKFRRHSAARSYTDTDVAWAILDRAEMVADSVSMRFGYRFYVRRSKAALRQLKKEAAR